MKVLIVEDNKDLGESIRQYLKDEGYICELCGSVFEAEDRLLQYQYDGILLDIMLPDGNGLELLRFMQQNCIQSCVLIISAKDALDDKVTGLDLGADDYITKPFHMPELHARLKAVFRRKMLGGDTTVVYNELSVDTVSLEAKVGDQLLDLTKKEFDLLLYFLTNRNRMLTRQAIAEHLWGDYTDNLPNFDFVYQHVKNLRRKINLAGGKDYITTVYGLGYKFCGS